MTHCCEQVGHAVAVKCNKLIYYIIADLYKWSWGRGGVSESVQQTATAC